MSDKVCPYCNGPLIKIDHYGEVLVGRIDCNRWAHQATIGSSWS